MFECALREQDPNFTPTENTCLCTPGNMDKTVMAALSVEQKVGTTEIPQTVKLI